MRTALALVIGLVLGALSVAAVGGSTALAPIHLAPGQQITVVADAPAPSVVPSCSVTSYAATGVGLPGTPTQDQAATWPLIFGWVLDGSGAQTYSFGSNTYPVVANGAVLPGEWVGYIGIIDQPRWYGQTAVVYFGPQTQAYNVGAAYASCSFVIS